MSDGRRGRISLTLRAALPLALMAGFYLLALMIVAGLASIIVFEVKTDVHIPGVDPGRRRDRHRLDRRRDRAAATTVRRAGIAP